MTPPKKSVKEVLDDRDLIFEFRPGHGGYVVKVAKSGQIVATIMAWALLDSNYQLFKEEGPVNDNEGAKQ